MSFNDLFKNNILFDKPDKIEEPASWVKHIPFAFFLLNLLKPKTIVELGVHTGNSFNSFCQAVKKLNLKTNCYGIDTWTGDKHAGFYSEKIYTDLLNYHKEKEYTKFAHLYKMTFDEALKKFDDNSIDLIHIDGYHTYEAVKHDYETWFAKLSDKSIVLIHDTTVKGHNFGIWKLWEEIRSKFDSFNFQYGYGLGVLAVGQNIDNEVLTLIHQLNNNDKLEKIFHTLGNSIANNIQIKQLKNNVENISRISNRQVQKLTDQNNLLNRQIENLTDVIKRKDNTIRDMQSAFSWKTANSFRIKLAKLKKIVRMLTNTPVQIDKNIDFEQKINQFLKKPKYYSLDTKLPIDIIVPVYNGFKFLPDLFDSIYANTTTKFRLIIVDDCSTDKKIAPFLSKLNNKHSNIKLIRNDTNLGFVKTINVASKNVKNHFVILNTDVVVPKNWLARLMRPIFLEENIASTTPFTNSGTICSFPNFVQDNELFENIPVDELDSYFRQINPDGNYFEIPTGVGFCMGINKNTVKKIGMFDDKTFTRGFGEENDWCMRASNIGFKNVIVPNLFVLHNHGGSFDSVEKEKLSIANEKKLLLKHPEYNDLIKLFVDKDPYKYIRDFMVFLISANTSKTKLNLIIDHDIGGGANHYRNEILENYQSKEDKILLLIYDHINCFYKITYFYKHYRVNINFVNFRTVKKLMEFAVFDNVIINDLVSYPKPLDIVETITNLKPIHKFRLELCIHDYYAICPGYLLLNHKNELCSLTDDINCGLCLKNRKLPLPPSYEINFNDINSWRSCWGALISNCDKIQCFSKSSVNFLKKVYLFTNDTKFNVSYHKVDYLLPMKKLSFTDYSLNIGVLGAINFPKGSGIIKEVSKILQEKNIRHVNIKIIGTSDIKFTSQNVRLTGAYFKTNLPDIIRKEEIDMFFMPSICPETFSYTCEEIMKMGFPIAVFDIGAPPERVKNYEKGIIIDKIDAEYALEYILAWWRTGFIPDFNYNTDNLSFNKQNLYHF